MKFFEQVGMATRIMYIQTTDHCQDKHEQKTVWSMVHF